jgi:hypothetical protein
MKSAQIDILGEPLFNLYILSSQPCTRSKRLFFQGPLLTDARRFALYFEPGF